MNNNHNIEHFDSDRNELLNYLGFDGYDSIGMDVEDDYIDDGIYSDGLIDDIDFSNYTGDFKKSLKKVNNRIGKIRKVTAPSNRKVIVEGRKKPLRKTKTVRKSLKKRNVRNLKPKYDKRNVKLSKNRDGKVSNIKVPSNRKVIVEGVSDFILSNDKDVFDIKKINYYKGEKLKKLVFTIDNDTPNDFDFELFNPSMPLDYLYNTSQNINDVISVSDSNNVTYTDVLHNLIANPTMIINAQLVFSGSSLTQQQTQSIKFKNKEITAKQKIYPMQVSNLLDAYQFLNDTVYFNLHDAINRPFCPDGMDILEYKVLAGMKVTLAFYYKQVSMKKIFFNEARKSKGLL